MSDRKSKPKKMRKKIQETSSSSNGSSSASSDEDNDVSDLKPIREYMSDRREMAKQLFLSVKPEKLRMMLPQNLKKMETNELEDWCANELSGMSKVRILAILNGQRMLESSESDDTIDSGPSLEIISDTEEWGDLSDIDVNAKDADQSSSSKSKSKKEKSRTRSEKTDKRDAKSKNHQKIKIEDNSRLGEELRVKKEPKEPKEKEGESLLDLLELEMRARAIRALIRKEEDIIPAAAESSTSTRNLTSKQSPALDKNQTILEASLPQSSQLSAEGRVQTMKVVRDRIQEMDSTLARVGTTHDAPDEEDVVLVVQPTTTIELLSSESESESQNKRVNQRLENERYSEAKQLKDSRGDASGSKTGETAEKSPQKTNNLETFKKFKRKSRDKGKEKKSNNSHSKKVINSVTSSETSNPTTGSSSPKTLSKDQNAAASSESTSNSRTDDPSTSKTVESTSQKEDTAEKADQVKKVSEPEETNTKIQPEVDDKTKEDDDKSNIKSDIKTAKAVQNQDNGAEDDKSTDLELIINLDDYPDDMEDPEPNKTVATTTVKTVQSKTETSNAVQAETWATRYYQTDDVQNVIKESKIQSEIRKRLRERQRLARLNVPASNVGAIPSSNTTMTTAEKVEATPTTGSVEEYMALKQVTSGVEANANTVGNDDCVAETKAVDVIAEAGQKSTVTN